jgi:hypothetical protein
LLGDSPKAGESLSHYRFDSELMLSDADDAHASHRDQELASCDAEETNIETSARGKRHFSLTENKKKKMISNQKKSPD